MNLADELDKIHDFFINEVLLIKRFLLGAHKNIVRKSSTNIKKLSNKHKSESEEIVRQIIDVVQGKLIDAGSHTIRASKSVTKHLMSWFEGRIHSTFLTEMTLVYLISSHEAFLKDYLKAVLTSRSEILSSAKTLTFEEIVSFQSMNELRLHMAEKELSTLAYESIDDVARYFGNKFNIDFESNFELWSIVREASYRRNMIIHNKGLTDKKYCAKTGYKELAKSLATDIDYVVAACDAVMEFIDFIHGGMKLKFSSTNSTEPNKVQTKKRKL